MFKILLVEDQKKLCENIQHYLQSDFNLEVVMDGKEAIHYLDAMYYDVVILDLMLPNLDGMSILKYIRKNKPSTGVIILTAKEDIGQKLQAFELGTNDYITKPFFMEELKARIYALLKTQGKIDLENKLYFNELTVDLKGNTVFIKDQLVELSSTLFNLLVYLIQNKDIILFKEQLFERICGYDSDASTEIIEVYISHLRRKLNVHGYGQYIVTKRGKGYLWSSSVGENNVEI